jgi:predicted NBD/HSP70 family sugar kinase
LQEAALLVARRDKAAVSAFRRAGEILGKELSDIVSLVGPHRVVLYGPNELVDESVASARTFLTEVRKGEANIAFDVKIDLLPKILEETTESIAAAATAVHYFLAQNRPRWHVVGRRVSLYLGTKPE